MSDSTPLLAAAPDDVLAVEGKGGDAGGKSAAGGSNSTLLGWDMIRKPLLLNRQVRKAVGQRGNHNMVYINLEVMDLTLKHSIDADIDFVLFTVFRDDHLVAELKADDAADATHHKTYLTQNFTPQFFGTSHLDCIHGTSRGATIVASNTFAY